MGWQKKQLAERAALHPSHIGYIENGTRSGLRPVNVERLAHALGVSVNYLVTGHEAPSSGLQDYEAAIERARHAGITPEGLLGLVEAVINAKPQES